MEGWRDLTFSKWRLTKGDEQLDFTYASSDPPHHISDEAVSELTYCIYKVRKFSLVALDCIVGPLHGNGSSLHVRLNAGLTLRTDVTAQATAHHN